MIDGTIPMLRETTVPAVKPEPTFLGWTWHAHFAELHRLVVEERWLDVAKRLSTMLGHALEKVAEQRRDRP